MNSLDPSEVDKFSALAETWWDPRGPFAPLHAINPTRMRFVLSELHAHFGLENDTVRDPLKSLRVLDVGTGGGLAAVPLARLGAQVTGLDASAESIGIARAHAGQLGLEIDYQASLLEDYCAQKTFKPYDLVLGLEVVEHVEHPADFVAQLLKAAKPEGLVIASTLNRNPKSFLLGVVAAEYLLGWVPRGTHDWRRFLTPAELAAMAEAAGWYMHRSAGLTYSPLLDTWQLSADESVNYLMSFRNHSARPVDAPRIEP